MWLFSFKILVGASVGFFVALTGLGGGLLLVPILIFGLGVPPIIAIGSDSVFNSLTKIAAGYLYWKRGTVNWWMISNLSTGSIPGVLVGVFLVIHLQNAYGSSVNYVLRIVVGLLLVLIPPFLLLQSSHQRSGTPPGDTKKPLVARI